MQLRREQDSQILVPELQVAQDLNSRTWGLMFKKDFSPSAGLLIKRCNSIHTCFMNFSIDCIFLDRNFKVVSIKENVKPWRFVLPQWGASQVVELKGGVAKGWKLQKGEVLNVGLTSP